MFCERSAITRARFTLWHSARALSSDGKTFLISTYTWQEDVAKTPKVPEATRKCKSGPGITWLVSVTI